MIVQLISQIDINHWTVLFLDGPWKDRKGDYRIEPKNYDEGQKLEVEVIPNPKRPEPTIDGYCGWLEVKGIVAEKPEKTKKKKE